MLTTPSVRRLIDLAIEEDLATGDITTELCVPEGLKGRGTIYAKEDLVICGLPMIAQVFRQVGWTVNVELKVKEGAFVQNRRDVAVVQGTVRQLLAVERIILNFLQRLSGIASRVRELTEANPGVTILDTRKTTPGWRMLEKYAVRIGGGRSHRSGLGDLIMVKNNHIDANRGDVPGLLRRIGNEKPAYMPVEVEVRNLKELQKVLQVPPDIIMLDNMSDEAVVAATEQIRARAPKTKIEVSGGIRETRLAILRRLGVEYVSMGSLTHSATAVDLSFRITVRR